MGIRILSNPFNLNLDPPIFCCFIYLICTKTQAMIKKPSRLFILQCLKTWLLCEACMMLEYARYGSKRTIYNNLKACADACFEIVTILLNPLYDKKWEEGIAACLINCRAVVITGEEQEQTDDLVTCLDACNSCYYLMVDLLPAN